MAQIASDSIVKIRHLQEVLWRQSGSGWCRPRRAQGRGRRDHRSIGKRQNDPSCAVSIFLKRTTEARSKLTAWRWASERGMEGRDISAAIGIWQASAPTSGWCSSSSISSHTSPPDENVMLGLRKVRKRFGRRSQARSRSSGSVASGWATSSTVCRANYRAASSSGWALRAPWRWIRRSCSSTRSPRRSIPSWSGRCSTVVQELAKDGMTMIVVTHEMTFARDVGTRIVFMDGGRIQIEGTPREVLGRTRSRTASHVPVPYRGQAALVSEEAHHV